MSNYPFSAEELSDVGMYPAVPGPYGMPTFPARKFKTPITPKENFKLMCEKKKPVWIPNIPTDFNCIQPECMPDAYARNHGGFDWFGIDWEFEPLTAAAMVRPGTRRLSEIDNWEEELLPKWPDLNVIDWQKNYDEIYKPVIQEDRATMFIIVNGLFERTADLTSFEDTFCYLLEEPEALNALYTKLTDFHLDLMKIAKEVYGADVITFHDDMGSQKSSFMSPDTYKEILLPHYKRMNDAAHDMGLYVNYHSCGSVSNQIENFCDAGFDFWEGQDACNDKQAIMDKYGDRMGQVSIFMPDPAESDEDFVKEIEEKVYKLGKTGRYITWFANMNPNRSVNGEELIYKLSRELYNA
ncbi:Uroporphyrinogen decarboxylase (URO-D) [Acetitomaculum ruminis DSM 5522]|uniref:Uroporphyrinogen decarboxylase (URO-D) n=1 Tax=Acetitomaculum ruminis DSM 5522 TaxID=1120918 RepID=A0A1I0XQ04_9FIRM|nr:uroporphyrinogen decarboxylase family protein [Acetitomaculum ruminis]SFB02288.1 Uroporphyrinogen decarboxylase (URO-D) [Acetitomaculum ruminis DSM 5522]